MRCSTHFGYCRRAPGPATCDDDRVGEPVLTETPSVGATLRAIAPSVFLPALIYEIGNGAIAPVIALTALDVGAGPSTAAFMLALLGVGQFMGIVPVT